MTIKAQVSNQTTTITVQSSNQNLPINLGQSAQHYNNLAKQNAEESKKSAEESKNYLEEIKAITTDSIVEITNIKNEANNEISNASNSTKQELTQFEEFLKNTLEITVANAIDETEKTIEEGAQELNKIKEETQSFKRELVESGMFKYNLFDTKISDHVLKGNEAKGWALQGTYVSGELYPNFYNKCLEEKNNATANETTLANSALTMFVNDNGHQFFNIADKSIVDTFYNTFGIADFYGVDEENRRIFLPRNKYFHQLTDNISKVNDMVKAGLPNITGSQLTGANSQNTYVANKATGAFENNTNYYTATTAYGAETGQTLNNFTQLNFNASKSNSIYGNSNTVQPPSSLKLLYYCVGNTVVNDAEIDAGGLVSQMELKANSSLDNINSNAMTLICNSVMQSTKYIDYSLGASGAEYIAPANGYFVVNVVGQNARISTYPKNGGDLGLLNGLNSKLQATLPCEKGGKMVLRYDTITTVNTIRFYYMKGEV